MALVITCDIFVKQNHPNKFYIFSFLKVWCFGIDFYIDQLEYQIRLVMGIGESREVPLAPHCRDRPTTQPHHYRGGLIKHGVAKDERYVLYHKCLLTMLL